jgi:NTP pyrophosphatase (non-canonical NTP hydrolase)
VLGTPSAQKLLADLVEFATSHPPGNQPRIAVGCAGGRHRSVALVEMIGVALRRRGVPVEITHEHVHLPRVVRSGDDQAKLGIAGELPQCAAVIADCLRRNGFDSNQAVNRQVLGLAEETGEFVGAYRRWAGQARRSGTAEEMYEELADVIITAFVTAHELGVDINAVIYHTIRTIHTRGWRETVPADAVLVPGGEAA